ncbi:hypothetical protein ACKRZS_002161 [Fusarium odoratissimum]
MTYLVKILGFALLFSTTAQAVTNFDNAPSGAHYAKGAGEPVCTLNGLTVTCTGTSIEGVGRTNADVSLAVTATFTGTCTNRGGNLVEPFTESGTTTTSDVVTSTKNGRLNVPEQSETATEADFLATFKCPNRNWKADVTDIDVTSFTYTLTFDGFSQPAITINGP